MKINKKNKSRSKKFLTFILIVFILIVGYMGAAYMLDMPPFDASSKQTDKQGDDDKKTEINYDNTTDTQSDIGYKSKKEFIDDAYDKNESTAKPEEPSGSAKSVTIKVSSVGQSNGTLQIRSIISALDEEGKCTLLLSRKGYDDVRMAASTQVLGTYSVCEGFNISDSLLDSGKWDLHLEYRGKAGQADTNRTIQVS